MVAAIWLAVALFTVLVASGFARRLGAALTAREGIGAPAPAAAGPSAADVAGDQTPSA